jgi:hypothetical protein
VRWSQLRANNAIGGDDAKWDADSLGLPVRVYAVIQFESSLGSGPEGLLMYSVESRYSRGKTDSPPRGPRPGPSLVPERAAAMVALRREDRPPFLPSCHQSFAKGFKLSDRCQCAGARRLLPQAFEKVRKLRSHTEALSKRLGS